MSTQTRPIRIKLHSTELATDVLRTIGYSGRCACGWVGPIRDQHSTARIDGRQHRRYQHDALSATGGTEAS